MAACPHSGQMQIAGLSDYRKQTDRAIENIQKSIDCINENFILKDDYRKLERLQSNKQAVEYQTSYLRRNNDRILGLYVIK